MSEGETYKEDAGQGRRPSSRKLRGMQQNNHDNRRLVESLRVAPLRSTSRASLYVPPSRSIEGLLTPNQNFSLMLVVAQVILLDPAPEGRARPMGNMRDVMHPLVVENRERCTPNIADATTGQPNNSAKISAVTARSE